MKVLVIHSLLVDSESPERQAHWIEFLLFAEDSEIFHYNLFSQNAVNKDVSAVLTAEWLDLWFELISFMSITASSLLRMPCKWLISLLSFFSGKGCLCLSSGAVLHIAKREYSWWAVLFMPRSQDSQKTLSRPSWWKRLIRQWMEPIRESHWYELSKMGNNHASTSTIASISVISQSGPLLPSLICSSHVEGVSGLFHGFWMEEVWVGPGDALEKC